MIAAASSVSVVIPTRNRARLLRATVASVLAQTHPDVEVVVVDDGSTDDTPALARGFGDRVTYLRQEHQGVEAARKRGLAHARGRYVNFLDDDDVMLPTKLARQAAVLDADPRVGVVHCRYHYVDREGRHLETVGPQPAGDVLPQLVWGCFPWSGGPLLRRESLAGIADDAHRDWHGDWGMWLRTALAGWRWACVQEPLGWYRMMPGSMTDDEVANCERLVMNVLAAVFADASLPPRIRAERDRVHAGWYGWLACRYYLSGHARDGARCLSRVVGLRPELRADPNPILDQIRQDALTPRVRVHDPLRLVAAVFDGLPPDAAFLAPHRARLEARVLVGLALRSWGAGDGARAQRELAAAIVSDAGVPSRPDEFRHELVAWAHRLPEEPPAAYVARVVADLPPAAHALAAVRARALADVGVATARGDTGAVRRVRGAVVALRRRPRLLVTLAARAVSTVATRARSTIPARSPATLAARAARRIGPPIGPTLRRHVELLHHLVERELKLRYYGSTLGAVWLVVQPLTQLVILVFLFQRVVPLGIDAYPAFVLSGLLPWTWFAGTLAAAGMTFVGNRDLMRRPGFSPATLVAVNVSANLIGYVASLPILLVLLLAYGHPPGAALLLLPAVLAVQGALVFGLSLAIATLNVLYRDVQQLVAVGVGLLFYLTPVFYRPGQAGRAALVIDGNPMAAIVAAHRAAWLGTPPPWTALAGAAAAAAIACVLGAIVYRRHVDDLVDRL